jgi:hypothetical protein
VLLKCPEEFSTVIIVQQKLDLDTPVFGGGRIACIGRFATTSMHWESVSRPVRVRTAGATTRRRVQC